MIKLLNMKAACQVRRCPPCGGQRSWAGFSLIELMIVVAIIGILAAIAYPSYQDSVRSTRRADAQGALIAFAAAMERHRTETGTYENADAGNDADHVGPPSPTVFASEAPLDGGTKFYNLEISAATRNAYTLTATPKNGQSGDGVLRLTSSGKKDWNKDGAGTWVPWTK